MSGRVRAGLRAVFVVQLGIAGVLLAGDFARVAPQIGWPSRAPSLEAPVAPGDQTRRFDPKSPRIGLPAQPDMPSRLFFDREADGAFRVTGEIAVGDAERFAEWLDGRPEPPTRLDLHSTGGSVGDALAIGRAIRAAGLTTALAEGAVCLSACPYILMGGVERRVAEGGQVGVHQHYYGENSYLPTFLAVEDIQRGQAEVLAYLLEMGIDPRLMRHSLATPPDEIYLLLPEELSDYNVVTPEA